MLLLKIEDLGMHPVDQARPQERKSTMSYGATKDAQPKCVQTAGGSVKK